MPDEKTGVDSFRFYLSGASLDGGAQHDADGSLGNFRSCAPLQTTKYQRVKAIDNLTIDYVAPENGLGTGGIKVISASELSWTPPGGTEGAVVTIADGETKIIEGNDVDKYIRVSRTASAALAGAETVQILDVMNNAVGFDDVSDAEASSGDVEYRAIFIKNENASPTTAGNLWVEALTTAETSSAAQLSGAGAGTIGFAANAIQDWPRRGGARIRTSGGSLREIVYYSSRTDSVLTVSAAHRALLGTSAGAGSATDTVVAVPLIRIAIETPVAGAITDQTGSGEGTQPPGLSWETDTANAISLGAIASGGMMGLRIERTVPAGMVGDPSMAIRIGYDFTIGSVFTGRLPGRFRVANDALATWEVYKGAGGPPDFDAAPFHAYTSIPSVVALGNGVHHIVLRKRNKFNVVSQNRDETVISITGGAEDAVAPTAPGSVQVKGAPDGKFRIQAYYNPDQDTNAADSFAIWYEVDGTTPDPDVDDPKAVVAFATGFSFQILDWTVGTTQLDQTVVEAIVRTRRTAASVDSANTTIASYTIDAIGPAKPPVGTLQVDARSAIRHFPGVGATSDYVVDAGDNIYFDVLAGSVAFYADTALIWRVIYDECNPLSSRYMYMPAGWTFDNETGFAGGGTTDPIEVISFTGGDKRLGVNVDGVRVMLIDVTNQVIYYTTRNQIDAVPGTTAPDAVWPRFADTLFLVWDIGAEQFVPYMSIDGDGEWRLGVSLDETLSQSAIEAL